MTARILQGGATPHYGLSGASSLPAETIHARAYSMDVGDDNYQAVTLKEVLRGVIGAVSHVINRGPRHQQLSGPSVDPQHIDGAHLRHHVGGNQHHDLVKAFLRADRFGHLLLR